MEIILYTVNVVSALVMVAIILLQQGKGADLGSGFGRGSSGSLFGARGSANFLTRCTSVLATVFFVSALLLTFHTNRRTTAEEIIDRLGTSPVPAAEEAGSAVPADGAGAGAEPAGDGEEGAENAGKVPE